MGAQIQNKQLKQQLAQSFDTDGRVYEILLMFYEAQPDDHPLNKIVSKVSPPFCHVELVFPTYTSQNTNLHAAQYTQNTSLTTETRTLYGSSIYQYGTVFFIPKQYSRSGYTSHGIRVTRSTHDKLIRYCQNASAANITFDQLGMLRACLPFVLSPHRSDMTFCSKFVVDAMQHAGIQEVADLDTRLVTPSSLYKHIKTKLANSTVVTATPHKLQKFTQARERKSFV